MPLDPLLPDDTGHFDFYGTSVLQGAEFGVAECGDTEEPYAALLMQHVRQRRARAGESLLASSAVYLAGVGAAGSHIRVIA